MIPDVIVLNGTSSAGKSSIARALQRRAGIPLYHASLDTFTDMFLWEAITDPAERKRCHAIGVDNFHRALALFAAGSVGLIVDHLLLRPEWDQATRTALTGRRVHFVGVRCPLAMIEARERNRPSAAPAWPRRNSITCTVTKPTHSRSIPLLPPRRNAPTGSSRSFAVLEIK